jgi:hypothetical protein
MRHAGVPEDKFFWNECICKHEWDELTTMLNQIGRITCAREPTKKR